jgi:hypothetical protein
VTGFSRLMIGGSVTLLSDLHGTRGIGRGAVVSGRKRCLER